METSPDRVVGLVSGAILGAGIAGLGIWGITQGGTFNLILGGLPTLLGTSLLVMVFVELVKAWRDGAELASLRRELRKGGGYLSCISCKKKVQVDLGRIEREIRARAEMARARKASSPFLGTVVAFPPDWDQGAVCKNCKGVLCPGCAKPYTVPYGEGYRMCARCEHPVDGIDHITD